MSNPRGPRKAQTLVPGDEIKDEETGDGYRVLSLVGEGGMGRVFKVERLRDGAFFAVKCNQPINPGDETLIQRTRNEAAFLKTLRHPHILPVLATGMTAEGAFWMIMPLLEGASVGSLLSALRRVPLVWAIEIARAICSALYAVHAHAIHRDIKPENVFVTRDGRIFLLDWGAGKFLALSRLTTAGFNMGTTAYASPEQLQDPQGIDGRSDLFAVGVLLFEMLSGQHPFNPDGSFHDNPIAIGWRIIEHPPFALARFAPELPAYMSALVNKLLSKSREDRNRDGAEAAKVLIGAREELRSRLGDPPAIERIFDAYDAVEREAARWIGQDTEKSQPPVHQTGPRPKLGTVPLAAFSKAPSEAAAPVQVASVPQAPIPSPLPLPAALSTGTEPIAVAAFAVASRGTEDTEGLADEESDDGIRRKLQVIEQLASLGTAEARELLLYTLGEYADHTVLRAEAAIALQVAGDEACLPALEHAAANDPHPFVRRIAGESVLAIRERLAAPAVVGEPASAAPGPLAVAPRLEPAAPPAESRHEAPSPWGVVVAAPEQAIAPARDRSTAVLVVVTILGLLIGGAVGAIAYLLLYGN